MFVLLKKQVPGPQVAEFFHLGPVCVTISGTKLQPVRHRSTQCLVIRISGSPTPEPGSLSPNHLTNPRFAAAIFNLLNRSPDRRRESRPTG